MRTLSTTERIMELDIKNPLAQFSKQNAVVFKQPKYVTERRLSPWMGKRRLSKYNKTDKKVVQQQKNFKSEHTERFLRKIFPHKVSKQHCSAIDILNCPLYSESLDRGVGSERQQQVNQSIIYLPIKPINFDRLNLSKQNRSKAKDRPSKQSTGRKTLNRIEPHIELKQQNVKSNISQSLKTCPISITFRKSWRKKQKCHTQLNQVQLETISLSQVYRLIGKQKKKRSESCFQSYDHQQQIMQKDKQQKSGWLVSRASKNNKKFKARQMLICKTQYI